MSLRSLFNEHANILQASTEEILAELNLDGLVIGAGEVQVYFEDDREIAYHCNHHFRHWCPLEGPEHILKIMPGQKPLLRVYKPADFWYEIKALAKEFWMDAFRLEICDKVEDLWRDIAQDGSRMAYHGPDLKRAVWSWNT